MSNTSVIRPTGPTYALSVANTQHAAVAITPNGNDQCNFAAFVNSGAVDVVVITAPLSNPAATPALTFPTDGSPTVGTTFFLHANMQSPVILAVPTGGFCVSAIGASAGPSLVYITPVGDQS